MNKRQKTLLYRKACERLITFSGLKVAVLGLTFKPGTDDLREAPSLENVPLLLEQGANLYVYDPVGKENFQKRYPEGTFSQGNITYVNDPQEALKDANICFVFTEWAQVKAIQPDVYKTLMKTPLVYDGRNIYDPTDMKNAGVEYYSVGR